MKQAKSNLRKSSIQKKMIDHFEQIARTAKDCDGKFTETDFPDESVETVRGFLKLDRTQAILFSIIFILSFNASDVDIEDIAEYTGTNNLDMVKYLPVLEAIADRKLIKSGASKNRFYSSRFNTLHDISFCITKEVLDAILSENSKLLIKERKADLVTLLEMIYNLIEERDDGEISFEEMEEEADQILQANKHLSFTRRLNGYELNSLDKILFLYLCRETLNGSLEIDLSSACEKIYDDPAVRFKMRRNIVKGATTMVQNNLIKLQDGVFKHDREVLLTDKALRELFDEDMEVIMHSNRQNKDLILAKDLDVSDLYFGKEVRASLKELQEILQPENYDLIINRLQSKKMASGIPVLFFGSPGTGKTASVYNIAKVTGRNIMMVDISATKSMWFGESEKIIKKVFDDYKSLVKNEKITPILLFNECDAVFSTRRKIGNSPVSQTENVIQNVILQQLEDLEGILIATTNLTVNLDPAFERRLLYKIQFPAPGPEERFQIWKNKLNFLKENEIRALAAKHNLTGGNIDNIARKTSMLEALKGITPDLKRIEEWCKEEDLDRSQPASIGFRS